MVCQRHTLDRRQIIDGVCLDPRIGKGIEVLVYEPTLSEERFFNSEVVRDLQAFKTRCDLIVANRRTADLANVADKVVTRDVFGGDV